jgi:hypothetical protein
MSSTSSAGFQENLATQSDNAKRPAVVVANVLTSVTTLLPSTRTLQLLWEEHRGIHPDGYGYSRFVALGFMLCGRRVRILGKGNKIRMCPLWPATTVLLSRLVSGRAVNEAVQASHRRRLDARADQTAGRRDRAQYRPSCASDLTRSKDSGPRSASSG